MVTTYDDSGRADQTYGNTGPGAKLNVISFVGVVFGFLLITNRLFWRWKKGTPGIDDLIIILAWLTLLGLGIVAFIAVDYGYGRHSTTLTRQEASDALRMFYRYQILYKLSLNLSKLSILTLYLRVFDTKDWFGTITKILIFIVTTYTTSIILANIFICHPISTYWSTAGPPHPGSCINILAYWYASSLYNILSESLMLFSVLARIWTLPSHSHPPILQFRQKINLTIVLGLGVFTVITAILRMTTLNQTAMALDRTGGTLTSTIWSSVEAGLGLAVANLPMVRQLLRWKGWYGGRWFRSSAEKSRSRSRSRSRARQGMGGPESTATAQKDFGSKMPQSRNPCTAGIGIGLRRSSRALTPNSQTYTDADTYPSPSSHEIARLHRDTERQATSTIGDDGDIDVDGYASDIDSIRPLQAQNQHTQQHQYLPVMTQRSLNPSTNTTTTKTSYGSHGAFRNGSGSRSGSGSFTLTDPPTPSITSTSISTLRGPTEPVPMVRISTEPRVNTTTSACLDVNAKANASVREHAVRDCPSPASPTSTATIAAADEKPAIKDKRG